MPNRPSVLVKQSWPHPCATPSLGFVAIFFLLILAYEVKSTTSHESPEHANVCEPDV
jgi:hypothetical protein